MVTGVDIDELDSSLTTGPRHGREAAQATARIEFTAAGTAEPRQMPARIGYALAMAAVPAQGDLAAQFTRDVPLPRRRRGLSRLFRRHLPVPWRLVDDRLTAARVLRQGPTLGRPG